MTARKVAFEPFQAEIAEGDFGLVLKRRLFQD